MPSINKVGPSVGLQAFRNLFDVQKNSSRNSAATETKETKTKTLKRFQFENPQAVRAANPGLVDDAAFQKSMEHYERAYKVFDEAVEKDWDAKWITKEMLNEAMDEIQKAIIRNPSYAGFYMFRGALNVGLGKFERAQDDFTQAIALQPDFSDEHFAKGDIYLARAQTKMILSLLEMFGSVLEDIEKAGELGNEDAEFVTSSLQEMPKFLMLNMLFKDMDDYCDDCEEIED